MCWLIIIRNGCDKLDGMNAGIVEYQIGDTSDYVIDTIDDTYSPVLMTPEFQDLLQDVISIKNLLAIFDANSITDMNSKMDKIESRLAEVEQSLGLLMLMFEKGDDADWQQEKSIHD